MFNFFLQAECRPVLCPNGFDNADGKCQLLMAKMLTDIYYVQLQLTPISDLLLPASYIEGLSFEQKRNPATWLDTNGTKLDCYTVSFHKKDTENGTFVKDLVVRAGQIMNRIRLDREIKTIRDAISKPWTISLQGEAFEFSVSLYRYQIYTPQLWTVRYDVVNLTKGIHTFKPNQKEEAYEEVVAYIQKEGAFIFKKTNFCNRVRLARSEWISGFQEIRLNTSKEVYDSEKMLGDSEFDIFLNELREPTVEICVEDFNPGLTEQKGSGKIGRNKATMLGRAQVMQVLIIEMMVCAILTYI